MEENDMKKFGFTYIFADDIEKMKWFYSFLLELELIWNQADSIAFKIGGPQLSISLHDKLKIPLPEFAIQPGWQGGTQPRTSWSIDCDAPSFKQTVELLMRSNIMTILSGMGI